MARARHARVEADLAAEERNPEGGEETRSGRKKGDAVAAGWTGQTPVDLDRLILGHAGDRVRDQSCAQFAIARLHRAHPVHARLRETLGEDAGDREKQVLITIW